MTPTPAQQVRIFGAQRETERAKNLGIMIHPKGALEVIIAIAYLGAWHVRIGERSPRKNARAVNCDRDFPADAIFAGFLRRTEGNPS